MDIINIFYINKGKLNWGTEGNRVMCLMLVGLELWVHPDGHKAARVEKQVWSQPSLYRACGPHFQAHGHTGQLTLCAELWL